MNLTKYPFVMVLAMMVALTRVVQGAEDDMDAYKVGGFIVGCEAYTFNRFTVFEAIDRTRAAGGKVIEFFLWQKLSAEHPGVILNENLASDYVAQLKGKLEEADIRPISAYVGGDAFARYGTDEEAFRRVFEFAKLLGLRALTGEPQESQLDVIEKMVKETGIQFWIHNHRKEDGQADYKYWNPEYAAQLLEKRDTRMGLCLDIGHLVRSGLKPVETITKLGDRLLALHLKDPADVNGDDTVFGRGIASVTGILSALREQKFSGPLLIEYEHNWENSVPEVAACIRFVQQDRDRLMRQAWPEEERKVTVPRGFRYEILLEGEIPEPLSVALCPDGRIWLTSRRGYIWAYDLKTREKTEIAHLKIPFQPVPGKESNERGLHGIEFDPGFQQNGFIYLFYTTLRDGAYSNRVSRFAITERGHGNAIEAGSERLLLEIPSTRGFHQGGALAYNPVDGKLYVSVGDNNVSGDTPKFFDDPKNQPQNLADLRGKMLRLNLDGTVPADNPFVGRDGMRPEIYTWGHRNPYSINVDGRTGRVYVGEVGYDRPQDIEEINLLQAGGNYGWPRCIGTNNGTFGGDCPITNAIAPWIWYDHQAGGASITSGPFYRATTGRFCFPKAYQDGFFYADFTRKWVRFALVDSKSNMVLKTALFARGFAGGPLSMQEGPDGAIYIAEYAGWFTGTPHDRLSRIVYDPSGAAGGN